MLPSTSALRNPSTFWDISSPHLLPEGLQEIPVSTDEQNEQTRTGGQLTWWPQDSWNWRTALPATGASTWGAWKAPEQGSAVRQQSMGLGVRKWTSKGLAWTRVSAPHVNQDFSPWICSAAICWFDTWSSAHLGFLSFSCVAHHLSPWASSQTIWAIYGEKQPSLLTPFASRGLWLYLLLLSS